MGGARQDQGQARPPGRPCAGDCAHEAPRRVPRHRRAARPRDRARPPGARSGERARRPARHPPAPFHPVPGARSARSRPAADARRAGRGRAGGDALHRGEDRCRAASSGCSPTWQSQTRAPQVELAFTEALFGFVPPPADERKLQRIRLDYRKVGRALTQIQKLDGSGVAGFKAKPYVQARAHRGRRPPGDRARTWRSRPSNETAGARRRRTEARTRRRGTSSSPSAPASVVARARPRADPLLVADQSDPANRGAARGDLGGELLGPAGRAEPRRAGRARARTSTG